MPLLLGGVLADTMSDARIIRLDGLPDFNAGDPAFTVQQFDLLNFAPTPQSAWVANGGGAGAVASGSWLPKEASAPIVGTIAVSSDQIATMRRLLLAALPWDRDGTIVFPGGGWDVDLQMFVRTYDAPTFTVGPWLQFSIPLVALDPYKYALTAVTGSMGVWTGEDWYNPMGNTGSSWYEQMGSTGSSWYEQMVQDVPAGPYPVSLTLGSDGDASSQRVTFTVTGPLSAGDWYLLSDTTGDTLTFNLGLIDGQSLTVDCYGKSATLDGADVTYLKDGDWLTLESGTNAYRLVAGTDSDGFATVSALPAYQ